MTTTTRELLTNISTEDLNQFATAYFTQAKQAGFTFEQLLKEANEVHPAASAILKSVFAHD